MNTICNFDNAQRKIRLRLHGTRLPKGYTISMRLPTYSNIYERDPGRPIKKRRKLARASSTVEKKLAHPLSDTSEEEDSNSNDISLASSHPSSPTNRNSTPPIKPVTTPSTEDAEDAQIRLTNAYPGASNTIGSIHQRQWFITFDRESSGFVRQRRPRDDARSEWIRMKHTTADGRTELLGFEPFYVRGRDVERSVVTGRTADEILADEGVVGFVTRKGWRAVMD